MERIGKELYRSLQKQFPRLGTAEYWKYELDRESLPIIIESLHKLSTYIKYLSIPYTWVFNTMIFYSAMYHQKNDLPFLLLFVEAVCNATKYAGEVDAIVALYLNPQAYPFKSKIISAIIEAEYNNEHIYYIVSKLEDTKEVVTKSKRFVDVGFDFVAMGNVEVLVPGIKKAFDCLKYEQLDEEFEKRMFLVADTYGYIISK